MPYPSSRSTQGFSLVELSIVLVILGLLIGGVLGGQSLIRAAELRSVSSDVSRFQTAFHAFRDKYFALPGDMPNAVRFWGAQAGGSANGVDATCAALDRDNPATGSATCNGNGNGRVWSFANITATGGHEVFRAWQHLANAGLVAGQFAGVTDSDIDNYTSGPGTRAGFNIPASRIGGGYNFVYWGNMTSTNSNVLANILIESNYGHVLVLGLGGAAWYHNMGYGPLLTPEDAWNIDSKMDDGVAGSGMVMTPGTDTNANCASDNTPQAQYALQQTAIRCGMIFKTGF